MHKRYTYHNRGEFFWTSQTETETPGDFWRRRLIEIEKKWAFKGVTAEDLLISEFMSTNTDTKLPDKIMKEKELDLKKTNELIKQNTNRDKIRKTQNRKL